MPQLVCRWVLRKCVLYSSVLLCLVLLLAGLHNNNYLTNQITLNDVQKDNYVQVLTEVTTVVSAVIPKDVSAEATRGESSINSKVIPIFSDDESKLENDHQKHIFPGNIDQTVNHISDEEYISKPHNENSLDFGYSTRQHIARNIVNVSTSFENLNTSTNVTTSDKDIISDPVHGEPVLKKLFQNALVLHAKQRTGSSFSLRFLTTDPSVFGMFEPINHVDESFLADHADERMAEILQCDFANMLENPRSTPADRRQWTNRVFLDVGLERATMEARHQECLARDYVAAKVIKLPRLSQLNELVRQGLKVWVLLRDPRGVMSSRIGIGDYKPGTRQYNAWNMSFKNDAERYCREALADLQYMRSVYSIYPPGQFPVLPLRYEDLAADPLRHVTDLYRFWGREVPAEVSALIRSVLHPVENVKETVMSTDRKNSAETPYRWRQTMALDDVVTVQQHCGQLISLLGYNPVANLTQLRDRSFSLMSQLDWKQVLSHIHS